jgi:hypothetical protein
MQNKDSMSKILHLKKMVPGMASQLLLTLTHHIIIIILHNLNEATHIISKSQPILRKEQNKP